MSNQNEWKYEVMKPEEKFKNKGYKDWVQDWSNWFYQPNPDDNNNGDVVFLRSIPFSDGVYRKEPNVMVGADSLVISQKQRVLVPIITANSVSYNTEKPEVMYSFVRSHILNGDNPPLADQLRINNEPIKAMYLQNNSFSEYEIETPIFQIAIPDDTEGKSLKGYGDNAIQSAGLFLAVTRGYFILLEFQPTEIQEDFYIESTALGATLDQGPYTASLFYHIIVNKIPQNNIPENLSKGSSIPNRPNRNTQFLIDKKYVSGELSADEYLKIMQLLRIPEKQQTFLKKAEEESTNKFIKDATEGSPKNASNQPEK